MGLVQILTQLNRALIPQTSNGASASGGGGSPTSSSFTLCTQMEHSLPASPDRETCNDIAVRPQLLSSAVFSCTFKGAPLGPETSSWTTPSNV